MSVTPEVDCTCSSTSLPLVASRMAEVANASRSSARCSTAKSRASTTKDVSRSLPSSVIRPSSSWWSTSRSATLWDAYGSGREPG